MRSRQNNATLGPAGRPRSRAGALARLCRRGFLAGAAALCAACVTPTLPPDDPPLPEVQLGEGVVLLSGVVPRWPASVFARNRNTGLIFGQTAAEGFYEFEVDAVPCDELDFWYTSRGYQSSPRRFVPAERSTPALPRGACSVGLAPAPGISDAAPAPELPAPELPAPELPDAGG